MDSTTEDRFYDFYYRLPDAPIILHSDSPYFAEYDPCRDVILIPQEAEEDPAYYFSLILHEYAHKKFILYLKQNRPFEKISSNDFLSFSEMVAEGVSACVCKNLGFYALTSESQVKYIRAFSRLLEDETLLIDVLIAIKKIASEILKQEVFMDNLPMDIVCC